MNYRRKPCDKIYVYKKRMGDREYNTIGKKTAVTINNVLRSNVG